MFAASLFVYTNIINIQGLGILQQLVAFDVSYLAEGMP